MRRCALFALYITLLLAFGCAPAPPEANKFAPEPAQTPAFAIALKDLPNPYTSEEAAANGDYVNLHGKIKNASKLAAFLEAVDAGETAALRTVSYTVEGDAIVADIVFDAGVFRLTADTTRDKFGAGAVTKSEYLYLLAYETESCRYLYLTDETEITDELFESGFSGYLVGVESVS